MSHSLGALRSLITRSLQPRFQSIGPKCRFGTESNPNPWRGIKRVGMSRENSKLQTFFKYAKANIDGRSRPTQQVADHVCKLMGEIPLEELGFPATVIQDPWSALRLTHATNHPPKGQITYMHLYEGQDLTVGIFCFAEGGSIPLHDHPGMSVFSRLLYGSLHVESYDLLEPGSLAGVGAGGSHQVVKARRVANTMLDSPAAPMVLFPDAGGNLHEFVATTPCAVLDLLTPPYDPAGGRDCTYFRPIQDNEDGTVELQTYDPPESFEVVRGSYKGLHPYL